MMDIPQKLGLDKEIYRRMIDNLDFNIRVAMPGIIQSFDPDEQVVEVLIAVSERVLCNAEGFVKKYNSNMASIPIPILGKVPIVLPHAGGYSMTFPIQKGDECLVVFADTCIDGWWGWGCEDAGTGETKVQECLYSRRHDLSDGFAILGTWSKPKALAMSEYSQDSMQIRTDDGFVTVEVKGKNETNTSNEINIIVEDDETADIVAIEMLDGEITIRSGESTSVVIKDGVVTVNAEQVNLSGDTGLRALIDERIKLFYDAHVHPDPVSGTTGVPTAPLDLTACSTTKTKAL